VLSHRGVGDGSVGGAEHAGEGQRKGNSQPRGYSKHNSQLYSLALGPHPQRVLTLMHSLALKSVALARHGRRRWLSFTSRGAPPQRVLTLMHSLELKTVALARHGRRRYGTEFKSKTPELSPNESLSTPSC